MESMAEALVNLMRVKPIGKITASEIADRAGAGRATWFRNFNSKHDALVFYLVRRWEKWSSEHGVEHPRIYTLENVEAFFNYFYETREITELLYKAHMEAAIFDGFLEVLKPEDASNAEQGYKQHFASFGLIGLLNQWAKRKYREAPGEMVEIALRILPEK